MIKGFEHVGMPVQNPEALVEWYKKMFDVQVYQPVENGAYFVEFANGIMFEVFKKADAPDQLAPSLHLAFDTTDMAADKQALIEKGVEYNKDAPAGANFFFKDPVGNVLHLVERAKAPVK